MLSLLGNATYGASVSDFHGSETPMPNHNKILFHSVEKQYFLKNLPWLIGSLGTIAEDIGIFIQFHLYATKATSEQESSSAVE